MCIPRKPVEPVSKMFLGWYSSILDFLVVLFNISRAPPGKFSNLFNIGLLLSEFILSSSSATVENLKISE